MRQDDISIYVRPANRARLKLPISIPSLDGNEERYALQAIRSTWISSTGKFVDRFEREFAEFAGTKHALSVSNGTAALHLALLGLNLNKGDEVLVPSLTYIATANAVRYVGAEPVFVDVDASTWCMDPTKIEENITHRTRAIIAVHIYGHPADMDAINATAAVHKLCVIEDAAEAHGATYKGRSVGGLSTMASFSFYGNKILSSGEGGALTLNDLDLYSKMKMLRGQGMDPVRRYYFPVVGYNYRMTNVACALLCAQLERYQKIIARRRAIDALYRAQLKSIKGIDLQPIAADVKVAPWLFCITVDKEVYGRSRDELIKHLAELGIETRPFFVPLHTLPPYRESTTQPSLVLPVTSRIAMSGLNLPLYPGMTDSDVEFVCAGVRSGAR